MMSRFNPSSVVIMGHSAGGQLALRLGCLVKCDLVVGIAPCCDLVGGVDRELGDEGDAVLRFMGGHYRDDNLEKDYEDAGRGLECRTPQLIVSGGLDVDIPCDYVRDYVEVRRGDRGLVTEYLHFEKADHYDLTNAEHESARSILEVILRYI